MRFHGFGIFKLLVVLGSNDVAIQQERVGVAVWELERYASTNSDLPVIVDVFITGGSKLLPGNDSILKSTEAAQMYRQISNQITASSTATASATGSTINYILDNTATNTVSNFLMLCSYLESTDIVYDEYTIVTSDFHYERSNRIVEWIFDNPVDFRWALSDTRGSPRYSVHTLRANEKVYMSMIKSDINQQSELSDAERILTLQFCDDHTNIV